MLISRRAWCFLEVRLGHPHDHPLGLVQVSRSPALFSSVSPVSTLQPCCFLSLPLFSSTLPSFFLSAAAAVAEPETASALEIGRAVKKI